MEAEFSLLRDTSGNPTLPDAGFTLADWQWLVYKGMGALIAKSCKAAIMLSGHSQEMQQHAYEFGKNIAYAHQVRGNVDVHFIVVFSQLVLLACELGIASQKEEA